MSALLRKLVAAGALATIIVAGTAGPAMAAVLDYVQYYIVKASYQGQPENLSEIASRFLGDAGRADEIFALNSGRTQPDGGQLTDPAKLKAGWALVLPWDAIGSEVSYGELPTAPPRPPPPPPPPSPPRQQPAAQPTYPAPAHPPPAPPAPPASQPSPSGPAAQMCAGATPNGSASSSQWANERVAPDQAWSHTTGAGVLVAVVDSGVDGSLPAFSGHVTVGADIVSGTGRGDTDCLGSGTAMAGIIAAKSEQDSGFRGVAPDATVMPVRLVTADRPAPPQDQATAIQVAVSAGAKVVALGSYVDPAESLVAAAIAEATQHDVVVVMGAPTEGPVVPADPQVLRVGAVDVDGKLAKPYAPGSVQVVAPGVDVTSLAIGGSGGFHGSGTEYAVAYVAGVAALVRAKYPNLTALQVVHRVMTTADRLGTGGTPDPQYGWGMINPGVAVTRQIAGEITAAAKPAAHSASVGRILFLVMLVAVLLVVPLALGLRLRRWVRLRAAARSENKRDPWAEWQPPDPDPPMPPDGSRGRSHAHPADNRPTADISLSRNQEARAVPVRGQEHTPPPTSYWQGLSRRDSPRERGVGH